ncbi:MAG TPA: substrate-binding domain-containing protein [Terriglobales bacterium]|nr:substrate-binding domain-containing protein [Terriglobales bacterium]
MAKQRALGGGWRFVLAWVILLPSLVAAQQAPPWSQGRNNPAADKGYVFQVDDVDNVPDLHGNPADARLVLFIGGNQFMVLPDLIEGFEKQHPELQGRIFYETLPPGILRRQMEHNGILTLGNLTLQAQADVYEAGARVLAEMEQQGQIEKPIHYASNQLEIMVHAGNPRGIRSLQDLGKDEIRLSMPNPAWEGVARQIEDSLRKAGGDALVHKVMDAKVKAGTAYLTHIHHRQTPMRILDGRSQAGVTWSSEVRFQEKIGNAISGVAIPASENTTAIYAAGVLRNAPHAGAARAWVAYLGSEEAQAVYRKFGFGPATAAGGPQ